MKRSRSTCEGYKKYNRKGDSCLYTQFPRTTDWRLRKKAEKIRRGVGTFLEQVSSHVIQMSDDESEERINVDSSTSGSQPSSSIIESSGSPTSGMTSDAALEDDDHNFDDGNEFSRTWNNKLHAFSDITVGETIYEILALFLKHKLTKSALSDWLHLISKILPTPHNFPGNKYRLFHQLTSSVGNFTAENHRYCGECMSYLGPFETTNDAVNCDVCGSSHVSGRFINIPVGDTVKHLLECGKTYKHLIQCSKSDDYICDVNDGAMYPKLSSSFDVHLMWNTDGVPVFKSSKYQIWPVLFSISNLPPTIRKQKLSLAGLWCGPTKPCMNTFLQPFAKSLRALYNDGVSWFHPELRMHVKSQVTANLIIVDAKARNDMQNLVACNGYHGCSFCEHPGELVETRSGHVIIYNFLKRGAPMRNNERMINQAKDATEKGGNVKGVLGPSCLSFIPALDLSASFVPDYMHAVAEGVVLQFLNLWLDSKNYKQPWYIGLKINDINEKLIAIKPTNDVVRTPRSLLLLRYWKGSELRNWLLFYSPFCLASVLPNKFYEHWLLLVGAIFLLLKDRVHQEDVKLADILLCAFCAEAEELYGKRHMSYNIHQLLHLGNAVKNWGPLWATSCFMFEDKNGQLLSLIKGTQKVNEQLVNATKLLNAFHKLRQSVSLRVKSYQIMKSPVVCLGAHFIGTLPSKVLNVLHNVVGEGVSVKIYQRVEIEGKGVFTSKLYTREKVRKSNTVMFFGEHSCCQYGTIECFVNDNDTTHAIINLLKVKKTAGFANKRHQFRLPHIKKVVSTSTYTYVNYTKLSHKVLSFSDLVAELPNTFERNL